MVNVDQTQSLASALEAARARYAYPAGRVVLAGGDTPSIEFGGKLPFRFLPANGELTSVKLDREFSALLRDASPENRRLGLASVVYWGFYTHSEGLARIRVQRLVHGTSNRLSLEMEATLDRLAEAREHVDQGAMGSALAKLGSIAQLSRTPFASKIVAFLSPETAGVYDTRIQNFLEPGNYPVPLDAWLDAHVTDGMRLLVGAVGRDRIRGGYQAWCELLQATASTLNGAASRWKDAAASDPQPWRAVDVERALFALAA